MNVAFAPNTLYNEHLNWLKNLSVCKLQVKSFQEDLSRQFGSVKTKEILPLVEQFQNKFIRQSEVIDELRHQIKEHENHLESLRSKEHYLMLEHIQLRGEFLRFYDLFIELERDFEEFLA